ncbi:MAG: hypothetical protein H6590_04115 [Flavobacteriales bacterium]|nr:hypothetical protein [Flavobacteriales bacterium]MCB9178591.1 hypothetical protein [Flavobacteriales bacterium]HPF90616.1 hypothetical protein [Flavobacteriales bacterium]
MRKSLAASVLAVIGLAHLAPLMVLLQFHLDRAHIERELCVQRDVVEAMRTCHGECQLSKRFRILEQQADQEFPVDRIATRFEPKVPVAAEPPVLAPHVVKVDHPLTAERTIRRSLPVEEPVPWS